MTALMVVPITVSEVNLVSTNLTEDDYAEWDAVTEYAALDRVISTDTHKVYEAVTGGAGSIGADPTNSLNIPTHWLEVGSTNRWRGFDQKLGQVTTNPDLITYKIGLLSRVDTVALIDLIAVSVKITARNSLNQVTYQQDRVLLDTSTVTDWLDFFTYSETYDPEVVFDGLNSLSGSTVQIDINNPSGVAQVSEVILGKAEYLGVIGSGSRSGFTDYSRKEVDDFGNITIVKRPTARRAEWELQFSTESNRRIQRALEAARGAPAFFYPGDDMTNFYISIYGTVDDFFPALEGHGTTIATLSLTGAT